MTTDSAPVGLDLQWFQAGDGTRLGYRLVGDGPVTVTAVHSLGLDGTWFVPFARALGDGYRVVIPDVRAHGASPCGPLPLTLAGLAQDIVGLWDHLDVERSAVVGISMGGMIAQAVAAAAPQRVTDLVLIATAGSFDPQSRAAALERAQAAEQMGMAAMATQLLPRWFDSTQFDPDSAQVARARTQVAQSDVAGHAAMLAAMTTVGDVGLAAYAGPALVLAGHDDVSTPRSVTDALAASLAGARYEIVPGGHLTAFTHPDQVADRVRNFLEENR